MMQRIQRHISAWRRRGLRDAVAIAAICFAIYVAARGFDVFDPRYASRYSLDELIAVTSAFGILLLIYALRRAQDFKAEINKRHEAGKYTADQSARLMTVFNNVSQGILMFDAAQCLVVCNNHYLEMYGLSPDVVKPGMTLGALLRYRAECGALDRDAEQAHTEVISQLAQNKISSRIAKMADGREIAITNNPMADGGWVATHEDRTESRRQDESFRLLFDNNPVAMCVFDRVTLRFLAVNDAAVAQYGYSRERLLTMNLLDIRVGEHESAATLHRALLDPQNAEYVGQHRRADGTKLHVMVYSRVLNFGDHDARLAAIHDVTERMLVESDLRRTKIFLDAVIDNVPLPIVVKTVKDGRFTIVNKASEELFGYRREETIGKTLYDIYATEQADYISDLDRKCLRVDQPLAIDDHTLSTPKGDRQVTSNKVPIPGDDGKPEYLLTLIEDVTERRQTERQIAHMAHSDSLTGLPNRAAFNEGLSATLTSAEAEHRSFAILCMDLDGFKEVNDSYGHAVGDSLLCHVADRLRGLGGDIYIARLGGDEFTIIAPHGERASIDRLTDRLLAAFADDFEIEGHRMKQSLSIGVAIYPVHGTDAKTLMKNADAALYHAKSKKSGSVQFFEAEMDARQRERSALQVDLNSAIERNELHLHYQPQLKITGEITGFEALARWFSPKRGMVPPAQFIPLAEESSLILVLGEWVLREACREAAAWDEPLKVAINVSPVQFRHGDLPRLVHLVLIESGLAPARLELEITEGVLIDDFSRAVSILRRLKSLGVQIVLDDFGTGYSSLSYLRAFPFDKIKIDRSFIADLEGNQQSIAIVRAVIGLSRSLHIPILAEGVESKAQHAFLAREGCDEVQGFLTGRPFAITDYADVVGRKRTASAREGAPTSTRVSVSRNPDRRPDARPPALRVPWRAG